jgi:catechol 2,3-dioxygenase
MTNTATRPLGAAPTIHPATELGPVDYTVASLARQIDFYQGVLGFQLHWQEGASAGLGAGGADLLRLTEARGARPARGATGLYHTAFNVPTRWELAQLLKRIAETRTPLQGMTDHYTHLALYLPDTEGNGIELAWDFPREKWEPVLAEARTKGMGVYMRLNGPLDYEALLDEELGNNPAPWEQLSVGARVGHVHLHVADLEAARQFYHGVLGFEIPMSFESRGGVFFGAGGYHHHIGTNVWHGVGAPPPPPDATGLRHFSIVLPDGDELARLVGQAKQVGLATTTSDAGVLLRDPSQNGVLLTTASAGAAR